MKIRTMMILLSALLMASVQVFAQQVVLDSVGSAALRGTDSLKTGVPIKFYLRFNNNTANPITGLSVGVRVFSGDGAQWAVTSIDSMPDASARGWGKTQFDGGMFFVVTSADGTGADTVGAGAFALFGTGAAAGANNIGSVVSIGPIPTGATFHHKQICIDSSWYPPGGDWTWSDLNGAVLPSWSGQVCYTVWDEGTGVGDGPAVPFTFSLRQNYPNPFNPTTTINYSLAEKSHVDLSIYNVLGQKIATLVSEEKGAGEYSAPWDASRVSSGVYFYRLETEKFTSTKKMMLVK